MPFSKASEFELKINTYKNFSKYLFIKNNLFLSYLTIENSIGTGMDISFENENLVNFKGFELKLSDYTHKTVKYIIEYKIGDLRIFQSNITLSYDDKNNNLLLSFDNFDKIPKEIKNKIQNKVQAYQSEKQFIMIFDYLEAKNDKKNINIINSIFFDYYISNKKMNQISSEMILAQKNDNRISMIFFIISFLIIFIVIFKFRNLKI